MWACDMSFHSSLRPHVTWDRVTVWAKLGVGVLLVINTTDSHIQHTHHGFSTLHVSWQSHTIKWQTWLSSPHSYQNGLNVSFSVNYQSERTGDSADQELDENPQHHQGAEFITVALGGNDLSPGKIPSDDLNLPEVANRLWDLYTKLSKNANGVDYVHLYTQA